MASPAEADISYLQEFWDMLSQTEDQERGPREEQPRRPTRRWLPRPPKPGVRR